MSYFAPISRFQTDPAYGATDLAVGDPDVRFCGLADLTPADRARWSALSAHKGAANIFAADWFMGAALRHCASAADVRLAIISRGDGPWLGVMPLVAEPRFGRWPARIWRNWSATNQFLGNPLVARGAEPLFWRTLLAHLDARVSGEVLLFLQRFATDDPTHIALMDHCEAEGRTVQMIETIDRPAYRDGDAPSSPSNGKHLGRLRSLACRLARDVGPVSVNVLPTGADCTHWTETFLAMEQRGWKGSEGSALAGDPANAALFREVIAQGHARGSARLATLSAGGTPLAMSSWFEDGHHGFGFKMAFDEQYRSYGPGQQLMRGVAEHIASTPRILFDTCTSAQSYGKCPLWPHRRTIADTAISIGSGRRRLYFDALMRARSAYATVANSIRRST